MFERIKNLKLVQKIKETVSPKSRLQEYADKTQLDKSTVDYLESVSGVNMFSDKNELEVMVRNQLKEEFPGIENKKSYELLVDAVMNNIMKKQLQADESNLDIEK
ncbi:hypothetical protein IJ674_02185 [bacterium]|jgi:hypothetical protein|nr:hypothetical protein [bacterium]MBR1618687.1 hypothetical protein [bacterium]